MTLLALEDVDVCYGESAICHSVSITVEQGEIVCILGRNGVGKTTLLRSIIGLTPCRRGRIFFKGQDISKKAPYEVARVGIGYVPQGRHIFPGLTVYENVQSGTIVKYGKFGEAPEHVFRFFPVLKERLSQKGGTLSGGEQQMLAIARSLAGDPELLLLDEPSEGIQPNIVQRIREIIKQMNRDMGLTIVLVEQNLSFARALGKRGYIMDKGYIVGDGSMEEIVNDEIVMEHLTFSRKRPN